MVEFDDMEDVTADDYGVDAEKYVPEGYKTAEEFLAHVTKTYESDVKYDKENREWALEDLQFTAGDQWDPTVKKEREDAFRPCLTINVLPQFVGQVIGDRRINKTTIKVRPLKEGTMKEAEVRSGLIKSIESYSRAERAYDAACEDQVTCGIGNLRVDLEYAGNDVFDQDILIRHVPNPLAVVWDRMSVDPTGRDARHCFVTDRIPKDVYDKKYPDYPCPTGFTDESSVNQSGWWDTESVRLTEFWELYNKPAKFAMMQDGDVKDVTGMDRELYEDQLWRHPATGATKERDSYRTYARMHIVTGFAILGEAYEIPLTRLPIVRVEGRVVRVGDDRVRFGLVRFAKDSQRLKNYWRSVSAEVLALAPKAQWSGPADAFEGREEQWKRSHLTGQGPLIWNKNASAEPKRVDPPAVPAALLQEAQMNQQDIKDTTGLHDASLGMRSNEVSGVAINARKKEGDVATIIYHDNLNNAIQEVGDVVNQLIPLAYDATRMVRVIGEDDKHKLLVINDPDDENSPDITAAKYDVVLETGPSFTTQRQEAMEGMMTLIQTAPEMLGVFGDIVAKNMDWPGGYEIAERLKAHMKRNGTYVEEEEEGEEGQPTQEQMMQMQQMQQQQQMQEQAMALEMREKEATTAKAEAEAAIKAAEAEAAKALPQRAELETAILEEKALQALADRQKAEAQADEAAFNADNAPRLLEQKIRLAERSASAKSMPNNRGAGPRPSGDRRKTQPKGNANATS
jgi:hypothetical protein